MAANLKPCPFCGGTKIVKVEIPIPEADCWVDRWYAMKCQNCGARSTKDTDSQVVAEAWNRRVQPASPDLAPMPSQLVQKQLAFCSDVQGVFAGEANQAQCQEELRNLVYWSVKRKDIRPEDSLKKKKELLSRLLDSKPVRVSLSGRSIFTWGFTWQRMHRVFLLLSTSGLSVEVDYGWYPDSLLSLLETLREKILS